VPENIFCPCVKGQKIFIAGGKKMLNYPELNNSMQHIP
jgi:hypothetical protein